MKYILSLDQGTTSSRAIVFDHDGTVISHAQKEFRQIYPKPGWVEHDGEEIWSTQLQVALEAMKKGVLQAADIAAIGIANQRETTLVWDRMTGRPIGNAIVWQDRRTTPACEMLKFRGLEDTFRERTGLLLDPYFSATKIAWILDNVPGVRVRAEAGLILFGTVDTWLLWNLTGKREHKTDISNASRTLLFNIHSCAWDPDLLQILNIPAVMLPEVCSSSMIYGKTQEGLFGAEIPITGMAGDQQAALFGQICNRPGMVKTTYGTGCFMLMNTGRIPIASRNRLLTTIAWQVDGQTEYALEGSVFIAGAAVQWLRDGLGIIKSSAEVEPLASQVPDSGGVFLVPAFYGLGAPHWDPYARGAIVGITRGITSAHIARATLESIAFQVADLLRAMEDDAAMKIDEVRVDGGAAVNDLLMQFQADILGVRVVRSQSNETTALGAAYLAGLAVGYWRDLDDIALHWHSSRVFDPVMGRDRVEELCRLWRKALDCSRGWEESEPS